MSFEVIKPGAYSLLVDAGRPHHRSLGVPLGGAADRASWMAGNQHIGNSREAVALEFALVGPTLRATANHTCVIAGAPFDAILNDSAITPGTTFNVAADDTLQIGTTKVGMRGYLCVQGGFRGHKILGSQTSLEPIKRGDMLEGIGELPARSASKGDTHSPLLALRAGITALRCIAGAQFQWFSASELFNQTFTVTPASNRMGLRLSGTPLTRPHREMTSEPVTPGTVQVLNDGQCVILGVDAQTIGGYPKIAHVVSADLDLLGQLQASEQLSFKLIEIWPSD